VIQPGGNRIRSYLDIVAPDLVAWDEIEHSLIVFISRARLHALPWRGLIGQCVFRIGMEGALAPQWNHEVSALLLAVHQVRLAP
jgi:hypothetical protein